MTISMTRTHRGAPGDAAPGTDVRARREAALARLNGGTAAAHAARGACR